MREQKRMQRMDEVATGIDSQEDVTDARQRQRRRKDHVGVTESCHLTVRSGRSLAQDSEGQNCWRRDAQGFEKDDVRGGPTPSHRQVRRTADDREHQQPRVHPPEIAQAAKSQSMQTGVLLSWEARMARRVVIEARRLPQAATTAGRSAGAGRRSRV